MNRLLKKLRRTFQNHKNTQSISSNQLMIEALEPRVLLSSGTEMVSISSLGIQGNDHSACPSINADGRYVAFASKASNLVADDTNGVGDVFVFDRELAIIERVSISSTGIQANNDSLLSSISADGRYVAFDSDASNLVADDTNGVGDIFVYDRELDITKRVSISSTGLQTNDISSCPTISANGQYVAFCSEASNLVADDTNGVGDVFVYDRELAIIERVNISSTGIQANSDSFFSSISADGRYIAFGSDASNLVPNDTSGNYDIFVYDRFLDSVEIVSISSNGTNGNSDSNYPSISADGRYVAFDSEAFNLVEGDTNGERDIFVYDRELDSVERVSVSLSGIQANGYSTFPSISADGRCVAFLSYASNLISGDTNYEFDVFVYDRELDVTKRVNISSTGLQANSASWVSAINADGQYVAFDSEASNLVEEDTNGNLDVYVANTNIEITLPIEVTLGVASGNTVSFRDADGSNVRVLSIGGQAVVMFAGANLSETVIHGTPTVIGDNIEIKSIDTICQGNPGMLMITSTGGDGRADIGDINGESLSMIIARNVNLLGEINLTGSLGMLMVGDIKESASIQTGDNIGMVMVSDDISGDISADGSIRMIMANGGDITGNIRAKSDLGMIMAGNLDHAMLSAGKDIRMVIIKRDIIDSYILGGYDVGTDCAFDIQEPGGGDLLNNGNIGFVMAGGSFKRSYIGAGVLPSGTLTSSLPNVGIPATGVGGNIRLVSFGSIDTNAQDKYGVFYSMSRGLVLVGGRLVDNTLDDYFSVELVS